MKPVYYGMLHQFLVILTIVLITCIGLQDVVFAATTANPGIAPLFAPVKTIDNADTVVSQADKLVGKDREIVRSNSVSIDINLLAASADLPPGVSASGRVIFLNLFDNASFVAEAVRVERTKRGITWIGRLRGIELSEVIIVTNGDVVSGNISMPGARYHIRYTGVGIHAVQEINQSQFPEDEPMVPVPDTNRAVSFQKSSVQADAQPDACSTIDVMVVYNSTSTAAVGGTAAMQSLIDLAVAETNQSYANSGITQRLRLVHAEEVSYNETGFDFSAALNCITNPSDGCLDNVPVLRDTYGADLVSFWVENLSYCGMGWMMDSVSPSFAPNGYSVVSRSCATGYYSFGHELGHNMGAMHDTYMDTGTTPYAYAHGYTYTATASPWRTVMAYNNACAATGLTCSRLQYWSNPGISDAGVPMGNASADNHQTLNNTACTVANFRQQIPVPVVPTVSNPSSSSVTSTTATLGATIAANGGASVTGAGVAYGTSINPDLTGTKVTNSATSGSFTVSASGLSSNTLYHYRGYATNSAGTGYAADTTFTTVAIAPTATSATSVGSISFTANWSAPSGTAVISSYRLDVSSQPNFSSMLGGYSDLTVNGTSQSVSGLIAGTPYYYRVRAVNAGGTSVNSNSMALYPLTYTFAGTGYGSVNSVASGINCTGTTGSVCAPQSFNSGSTVILSAAADLSSSYNSTFTGWSTNTTACPGTGTCSVTMNIPVNVAATFNRDMLVNFAPQTSGAFGTILQAIAAAAPGQIIQVRDNSALSPFTDDLPINKSITLKGGFASGFTTNTGYTTTNGILTIGSGGVLTTEKIVIK